jgi:hypothetical protein
MIFFLFNKYYFLKLVLIFVIHSIITFKLSLKSIKITPTLFKNLNNFKEINLLINRYIFKNNYSETIF